MPLGAIPWTRDALGAAFFAVEAAAFLAATGVRRPAEAWLRAALVGILAAGLGLLVALRVTLFPPRLALDGGAFERLVLPLAALALLGAGLAFPRAQPR